MHELAHAMDFIAEGKGYKVYAWHINHSDVTYDRDNSKKMGYPDNPQAAYWDLRAVHFENAFRKLIHVAPRLHYNGVSLNPLWKKMVNNGLDDEENSLYKGW